MASTWTCGSCGEQFEKSKLLERHAITSKHRAYICQYPGCNKSFHNRTALVRHKIIHVEDKQHQCAICSKTFHRKDHRDEHQELCQLRRKRQQAFHHNGISVPNKDQGASNTEGQFLPRSDRVPSPTIHDQTKLSAALVQTPAVSNASNSRPLHNASLPEAQQRPPSWLSAPSTGDISRMDGVKWSVVGAPISSAITSRANSPIPLHYSYPSPEPHRMSPPDIQIDHAPSDNERHDVSHRPGAGRSTLEMFPGIGFTATVNMSHQQRPSDSEPVASTSAASTEASPQQLSPRQSETLSNPSTSNASDQRHYILDIADPKSTPSNKQLQKMFQCNLCPSRFARAFNLRTHLYTHTGLRNFICTVCGKRFARQSDRKRHESLHSGEKKFVCRGELNDGNYWGCGRRFALAQTLGRHFRSAIGRTCIKPLLDEEAAERQKAWIEEQQQAQRAAETISQANMMTNLLPLPAALLEQYPALKNIDWNNIPHGPSSDDGEEGRDGGGESQRSTAPQAEEPSAAGAGPKALPPLGSLIWREGMM